MLSTPKNMDLIQLFQSPRFLDLQCHRLPEGTVLDRHCAVPK